MKPARPVIGLVGQVCAGKSTVARIWRRWGAVLLDLDETVREFYRREEIKAEAREYFGGGIFDAAGEVERGKLADRLFNEPELRAAWLSRALFPRVRAEAAARLAEFRAATGSAAPPAAVVEAPTLFEAGLEGECDYHLFVSAPLRRRLEWARARGWGEGELARREACLQDEAGKRARCAGQVENSGTEQELERQNAVWWERWVGGSTLAQLGNKD